MDEIQAELERLRLRLEYTEAMARQLRRQAEDITRSRTWRLLTGADALRMKLARKLRRTPPAPAITAEQYHRWIADCERREIAVADGGPRFGIVAEDRRTLASLRAQTYGNWEIGAAGDFLIMPGPGDELAPDALYLFAQAAREGADFVYCDEDALDERGLRTAPWFKPDWSPDLMAEKDYIGRAFAVRRELAGRPPSGSIAHVPRVLYHGRARSCAAAARVRHPVPAGSRVEILVPSRDPKLLARCLKALRSRTAYADYGIALIDNSEGEDIAALAASHGARHVDWRRRPFNYSAMNNAAAAASVAPLLLFLNDDIVVREPGWLEALVEHAVRPEVGIAGARLLYPDGRIQHAGVAIGIFGVCGHVFKGWPRGVCSYGGLAETTRNVSAVTGACLMMRAEIFRQAKGFDETAFPVAYNDIDLCLRVLESGKRVVYTPWATLEHHEAYSKPWSQRQPGPVEIAAFQSRWLKYIRYDPFYNPNLTRADESCGLRSPEEWI